MSVTNSDSPGGSVPPLLRLLEAATKRWLALDPDSSQRLAALEGRLIAIDLEGIADRIFVSVDALGLHFEGCAETEPDVVMSGRPLEFLRVVLSDTPETASDAGDGLRVSGDAELAQQFAALVRRLDIDWEEHASRWLGDFPARKLANLVRDVRSWSVQTRAEIARNTGEYLQEEQRLLTARWRVEQFLGDVDDLRSDVERLGQRIERLRRSIKASASG